jgi:hypothetical protein
MWEKMRMEPDIDMPFAGSLLGRTITLIRQIYQKHRQ